MFLWVVKFQIGVVEGQGGKQIFVRGRHIVSQPLLRQMRIPKEILWKPDRGKRIQRSPLIPLQVGSFLVHFGIILGSSRDQLANEFIAKTRVGARKHMLLCRRLQGGWRHRHLIWFPCVFICNLFMFYYVLLCFVMFYYVLFCAIYDYLCLFINIHDYL